MSQRPRSATASPPASTFVECDGATCRVVQGKAEPMGGNPWSPASQLSVACAMGVAFGIAMEKARVTEPFVIRDQMAMSRFIMMKMFLSAVVAGQIGMAALSHWAPAAFARARQAYAACVVNRSFLGSGVGGFLLGAGMSISGACPGMVVIQFGAGVPNAVYTLAGLMAGTFVYSSLHPFVQRSLHASADLRKGKQVFLESSLGVSYWAGALGFSAMLGIMIAGFEWLFPWTTEVPRVASLTVTENPLNMHAWSPIVSGCIVGALQIPAIVFLSDTLGSATCYMTIAAQATKVFSGLANACNHLCQFRDGMQNWWQVAYILAAAGGAYISASLGEVAGQEVKGVSVAHAFFGGLLMMLGSRTAGGCTSGHGLSGMGILAINSFIAVPAMFAGGMVVRPFLP